MKKLNTIIISLSILLFLNTNLKAQNENNTVINNFNVNAETGASIGKINNTNYFSTYTMPSFSLQINPKLSINTGLLFMSYKLDAPLFQENRIDRTNHTAYRNYLFTQVNYRVNEKLTINGNIMSEMSIINFGNDSQNNPFFRSYSVGADYQINEYLQIGVQFRQSSFPY